MAARKGREGREIGTEEGREGRNMNMPVSTGFSLFPLLFYVSQPAGMVLPTFRWS
jgi:hypothetical protein